MYTFLLLAIVLFPVKNAFGAFVTCPSSCYCDDKGEDVSCVGDGLWRFPDDIPATAVRLELRNYLVSELYARDLSRLALLEQLKLQQSRIEVIDNTTFELNSRLERLDLGQNLLTELAPRTFGVLPALRHLDLSSNTLDSIEGAFTDSANLETLNLRDNRLPRLTTRSFSGLHKIQYLNLDANNISAIEVGTFQYLTNLAHLIVSNNPLTALSRLDFFGSRLQYIDLSRVGLDRVPQSLTRFVRDLRLAKNQLTRISAGDFDSYPYLGLLVLDDNCVTEIENDALGRQEYLVRLWLNGNCLTRVPPNLPPSLLALYMEENRLTTLPKDSFKGLVHLEQLFLQRNEIQTLAPYAFCDLVSLKSLDLQANQIENLTFGVFSNLTQLEMLDLSQNPLRTMDGRCFDSLARLTTLQMSRVHSRVEINNGIFDPLLSLHTLEVYDSSLLVQDLLNSTRILHGLRTVQELNIMHNRISRLRSDFPSFFPALKVIKMSGNLWVCDRDIKWLAHWIKQSNVQFYNSYNIRCSNPDSVHFKPIMMLTEEDFEKTDFAFSTIVVEGESTPSLETRPLGEEVSIIFRDVSHTKLTTPLEEETSHSERAVTTQKTSPHSKSEMTSLEMVTSSQREPKTSYVPATTTELDSTTLQPTASSTTSTTHSGDDAISGKNIILSKERFPITEQPVHVTAFARIANSSFAEHPGRAPLRRSSRLRVESPPHYVDHTMVVLAALAVGCFLLGVGALVMCRLRHPYQPVKQRRSSISYYPQKDEVSIVTLTEGTIGLRTSSHHGLGNKLYYIMENTPEAGREAPPPDSQELLLSQSADSSRLY